MNQHDHFSNNYDYTQLIDSFSNIRNECPVLKYILPDDIFDKLKNDMYKNELDASAHCSKLIIAFRNGYLFKLTAPFHKYLFDENGCLKKINSSYMRSLQEYWYQRELPDREKERFKEAKIHDGKLHELVFANYLSEHGYHIKSLAALDNDSPDIYFHQEFDVASEVKVIGDERFFNPEKTADKILARLSKAAKQLKENAYRGKKLAIIIIYPSTWLKFKYVLRNPKYSIATPRFFDKNKLPDGFSWNDDEKNKKEDIIKDLENLINELDGFWIFRTEKWDYDLKFQKGIEFKSVK